MKFITPIRKKLPVTSWRISSQSREHWRSGRMRVAFISRGGQLIGCSLSGLNSVAHEHGDSHWTYAAGVGGNFTGNGQQCIEVYIADQSRAGFGCRIADAIDTDVNNDSA